MENKNEIEKFAGIGADEFEKANFSTINEKIENFIDEAREKIESLVKDSRSAVRESFLKAYDNLDKEVQEQISQQDIEKLVNGEEISGEAILQLQEERKKQLEIEDKEMFDKFHKAMKGELTEDQKKWNMVKRSALIGLFFGFPGALFMIAKDSYDYNKAKNIFKEAVEETVVSGNNNKIGEVTRQLKMKMGNIVDIDKLVNNMLSSDVMTELKDIDKDKKCVCAWLYNAKGELEEQIDTVFNEMDNQEEIIEETTVEEEDPEPVEGMKLFM